jgi:hypothetical protein
VSEAEILEQLFSVFDRYWFIVQWWASVSFGLIMVAYFAANKLSALLVGTVLCLYLIYSGWVYMLLVYNIDIGFGLLTDLSLLNSAGELKTQGAKAAAGNPFVQYGTWLGNVALPLTFFACIGYLLYAYFHARKNT